MGTGASKARPGVSTEQFVAVVAEEASNASEEALTNAFTGLSDSERQRVTDRVERFDRRGTEPFEPFEPFEFFPNRNFH